MTIEYFLVLEIERNYHLLADIIESTIFIWQKGFKPTKHSFVLDGEKSLSELASELVASHYENEIAELVNDDSES